MKNIKDLLLGYRDAENYKRRENKELFNKIFIRTAELEKLCEPSTFFLIGEKGTGKTAYAVYLGNNTYHENIAALKYLRETDYQKFVALKTAKHLDLSDYTNIWKIILYLLISEQIASHESGASFYTQFKKFRNLKSAIDEYYKNAFTPEILYAIQFAENSEIAAQLIHKYAQIGGKENSSITFNQSQFQTNLFYIQRQFEDALRSLKLSRNYLLFIDGIDIRPGSVPYVEYLECIKGLANAIWAINNDFFANIKGSKGRMRSILLVRPDIFDSLGLQNQNSKLRDNSVVLDWLTTYTEYRSSNLFNMADRLLSFQQDAPLKDGEAWEYYFPFYAPQVGSRQSRPSSFISFLRHSMYRPRDILAMLGLLKENYIKQRRPVNEKFVVEDFTNPMFTRKYSDYLLGEVKDQVAFYYTAKDWDQIIIFFQCFKGHYLFSYAEYLAVYDSFIEFLSRNKTNVPEFAQTADVMLQFLYDLGILCYMVDTADATFFGWCFRDRTTTNISPKVRTHVKYKIHFGIRKALDLGKELRIVPKNGA